MNANCVSTSVSAYTVAPFGRTLREVTPTSEIDAAGVGKVTPLATGVVAGANFINRHVSYGQVRYILQRVSEQHHTGKVKRSHPGKRKFRRT